MCFRANLSGTETRKKKKIVRSVPGECCLSMARTHDWDAKETGAECQKRGGREKHAGWVDGSGNKVSRGRGES